MTSSNRASSITLGSYQLHERIGEGGTARVYRAEGADGTAVAVKLLAPSADLDDDAARARFHREIAALAALDHPRIVRLLDSGVDDELGPYLVTPLVPGATLRDRLAGARLCPEAVWLVLEAALDAVAALHDAGLVHRDLKPENLMATPDGEVVLMDLGLAYRAGQTRHTDAGAVVGSVPYMAPEQIEGGDIAPAADVWALGVMAYEWLTGARPFQRARPAEEAAAALVGAYTPARAVDRRAGDELDALIAACLQRDPAARPAAAELLDNARAAIDWCAPGELAAQRAAALADPSGYHARVAPVRVARRRREAEAAIAAGDAFGALRAIDRALAYAPDDRELRALSERAESATAPPAPSPSPPPRRARWPLVAGALATVAAGVAIGVAVSRAPTPAPAALQPAVSESAALAASDDTQAIMSVFGGLMDVMERGVAAQTALEAAAPPPGVADVVPIPLELLSNDDPPRGSDMRAPPGEQLVPRALLGTRDPDALVAEVDAELAAAPTDREKRLAQAMVYLAVGRERDGLRLLDAVAADHPQYPAVWAALGFVEIRRGRHAEAERALTRAIELDPGDAQSLRNRGIYRHRLGRTRDAYVDLTAAIAANPNDVEALKELTQIYERAGRRADARPLLERVVRLEPRNPEAWLDLSLTQPPAEALASIERARALAPDDPRAESYRCTELARQQKQEARAACERAVQLAPDDADNHMHLGLAYYNTGDDATALRHMDRAIAMNPRKASFFSNRYIVRTHAGDNAAARADLQRACDLGADEACAELQD